MEADKKEQYYDRDMLYSEVWKHTIIELCKQYGVKNSEFVKACKTLNVPRPPVGYWTQKELGKAPLPPELPIFNNPPRLLIHPPEVKKVLRPAPVSRKSIQESIPKSKPPKEEVEPNKTILSSAINKETDNVQVSQANTVTPISNWKERIPKDKILVPQAFESAINLIEKETLPEMKITSSQVNNKEHPYVKNTRLELEKMVKEYNKYPSMFRYGRIKCQGKDLFDVNIGPDSVQRVLNILQVLCDAFNKRGFDLASEWDENNRYGHIHVMIIGEKISFSITENYKRIEANDKTSYSKYEYVSAGKLTLGGLYQWNDTNKSILEEKLNDIVAGFIFAAAWEKENKARREKEEEERKRREAIETEKRKREATIKAEKERLARIVKQRIVNFKEGTEYWVQYQNMVAFLKMVKKTYRKSGEKNSDVTKWIHWAVQYLEEYKINFEELIRYDVGEYNEYKEKPENFRPIYNPPPPEPFNYWKRPWYMRKK
ncbi:MAG: hypothetical protein LBH43_13350 [Treponema sp.]|nr:hypothetical protein [Treponema sp.]